MNSNRTIRTVAAAAIGLALALPASQAFAASRKTENAILGGLLGAAAGALITKGDTTGIVGGAAAGALIGSATTKDRRDRYYSRYDGRQAYRSDYRRTDYGYGRGYNGYDGRSYYGDRYDTGYGYYGR